MIISLLVTVPFILPGHLFPGYCPFIFPWTSLSWLLSLHTPLDISFLVTVPFILPGYLFHGYCSLHTPMDISFLFTVPFILPCTSLSWLLFPSYFHGHLFHGYCSIHTPWASLSWLLSLHTPMDISFLVTVPFILPWTSLSWLLFPSYSPWTSLSWLLFPSYSPGHLFLGYCSLHTPMIISFLVTVPFILP